MDRADPAILPEAIAQRWQQMLSEFEESCRTGSKGGSLPGVDPAADAVAALARGLAQQILARIRGRYETNHGTEPPSQPGHTTDLSSDDPSRTTDLPSDVPPTGYARKVLDRTAPPDAVGAERMDFTLDSAPDPDATGPANTTDISSGEGAVAPTPTYDQATAGPKKRKIPTIPGYQVTGVLGRGGMGVVYKATQLGLNRQVALKMILSGEHAGSTQLVRFQAEARAVAAIRHPNIVQIYEIGEHDGLPYFSLEFCPGGSLDRRLNKEPQSPKYAAELVEKLARAMAAAHTAGVIHRDLKPANVLLDSDGTPKVTDFGLARELDDTDGPTRDGSILGTPSFMAPEQAAGRTKDVGPLSDQYSLGATLYDMLTGRPPFQGTSVMETLEAVRTREPLPPRELQPNLPKDLETICLKALSKEAGKRYATCDAFADDLRAYLEGRPIAARPVGVVEKGWRWAKRNPKIAGLSTLAAFGLLAAAVLGLTFGIVFNLQKNEIATKAKDLEDSLVAVKDARDDEEKAKNVAIAEKKTADESNLLARESLVQVGDEIPLLLDSSLVPSAIKEQIFALITQTFANQLSLTATRNLPDRALYAINVKMGDLLAARGQYKPALTNYTAAESIADRLWKAEAVEKDKAKGNLALVKQKIGELYLLAASVPNALKYLGEAEQLNRERVTHPESAELTPAEREQSLAVTLYAMAEIHRRTLQFEKAIGPATEAARLLKSVLAQPATTYTRRANVLLVKSDLQLGKIEQKRGHDTEAETALKAGVVIGEQLVQTEPNNPAHRQLAALVNRELGDFLLMRNRLADATPYHEKDLELIGGLLTTTELIAVQNTHSDVLYRSATLAAKKHESAKATALYRKCLALRQTVLEAKPNDTFRMLRVANAQARAGESAAAAKLMSAVLAATPAEMPNPDKAAAAKTVAHPNRPTYVIEGASVFGLCGGDPMGPLTAEQAALRKGYFDQAFALLDEAITRFKFSDVVRLNTDPDFDPLRTDARFAGIVERAAKAKPGK